MDGVIRYPFLIIAGVCILIMIIPETLAFGQQSPSGELDTHLRLEKGLKFAPGLGFEAGRGPLILFYFQRNMISIHVAGKFEPFSRERIDRNTVRINESKYVAMAALLHLNISSTPWSIYSGIGGLRVRQEVRKFDESTGTSTTLFSSKAFARQGIIGTEYRLPGEPLEFFGGISFADVYESKVSTPLVTSQVPLFEGGFLLHAGVRLAFGETR